MKRSIQFHNVLFVLLLFAVSAAFLPGAAQGAIVGYWDFDEGAGTAVADFSANDNDGTLEGGDGTWVTGHTGNTGDYALNVPFYTVVGGASYVKVLNSDSIKSIETADKFTIALWVRQTVGTAYGNQIYFGNAGSGSWYLQTGTSGDDQLYMWSNTSGNWQHGLGNGILGDGWTHVALTYDGTDVKLYVDGTEKTTKTPGASFPSIAGISALTLGGANGTNTGSGGDIDDVVIFNSVEDVVSIRDGTHADMVPEPATMVLLGLGGLQVLLRRKRR